MNSRLKFVIPGKPVQKNRPRFSSRGKHVHVYSDQVELEAEHKLIIESQMGNVEPYGKGIPLEMNCIFIKPLPKSKISEKKRAAMISGEIMPTQKPDGDNYVKWVKDVCNSIVWHDDAQVIYHTALKRYGEEARTLIYVNIFKMGGVI